MFLSTLDLWQNAVFYARAYTTKSMGTSYGDQVSFTTLPLTIGLNLWGGIIFYLDGTGQHGLICVTTDQSTGAQWGCYGTSIQGTSTAIGTGNANTTAIVNGCAVGGIAARVCFYLSLNGYDDWYLPSNDELDQLNLQKAVIGGFTNTLYWSSSQSSINGAWSQNFTDGSHHAYDKSSPLYVRAIRSF
jgi:hypothetical protein